MKLLKFLKPLTAAIAICLSVPYAIAQTDSTYISLVDFDDAQWWRQFNDPLLDSIISVGLQKNYDVVTAAKRIRTAQYTLAQTRSGYYPNLGVSVGWNKERMSGYTSSPSTAPENLSYLNGSINLSWEVDLFGRITAKARESKAQLRVTRAEYAGAMVSLQAQIASTYFELRMYQAELDIARRHAASQENVVKITEVRHETGLASELDVAQAKTTYYSTLAAIPQIENNVGTAMAALAVLLGEMPDALNAVLSPVKPLPDCRPMASFNIPMSAIERRPDVVEARQNIEAMAAALGVAKKEYLPMLEITGSIGTEAHRPGDLFRKNSFTYSFVPTLSWTIFDGFSRRAGVNIARENMEMEVDAYNNTLLNAYNDADNAMGNYFTELECLDYTSQVVKYAAESEKLSLELYKQGLGTFTNVDNSMITFLTYELQLVESQQAALNYLVTLYKALGGGWDGVLD